MKASNHSQLWKHLHMRGADILINITIGQHGETSPHAWSRLVVPACRLVGLGNISTCVEQTRLSELFAGVVKKHLHMRGAD